MWQKPNSDLKVTLQHPTPRWKRVFLWLKLGIQLVGIGGFLVGLGYGAWLLITQVLVVKTIRCFVENQELNQEYCQSVSALRGKSLFWTDFNREDIQSVLSQVVTPNQVVIFSHLRKTLRGELLLFYQPSQPQYIVTQDKSLWLVVDSQGRMVPTADASSHSRVFISQAWGLVPQSPTLMEAQTHQLVMAWLSAAHRLGRQLSYIGLDAPEQISLLFTTGQRILVLKDSDPGIELARLTLIEKAQTNNPRIQDQPIQEIDLRFKFPVIRLKP